MRPSTRRRQGRRKDQTQDAQAVDQQAQGGRGVGLPEGGGVSDAGVSERRDGTKAVVSGVVLEEGREEGWEELKQEEAVKHSQWRGEHQRNAKAELILDEETVQRRQAGG